MRRREFIAFLGGAAAWPLAALAQQPAMPVVGLLTVRAAGDAPHLLAAFRQGLQDTGFVERQNVAIEYRFAGNQNERLPALAADLVNRQVTVIAASPHPPPLQPRRRPRPFRSSSKLAATRSNSASSPASTGRAPISLAPPV